MWFGKELWEEKSRKTGKKRPYSTNGQVWMIPTAAIQPNPDQPRKEFSYEKLLELAQSIAENGLLHPLTITFREDVPVLVSGERRLRAAKIAGMREIPCIELEADGVQRAILALVENLQREDMNCFETAEGMQKLIELYGLTQEEAANRLGCSQPTVANKLRLLRLPQEERSAMIGAGLTERHARALLRIDEEVLRRKALARVIEGKLTVAQTERLVMDCLSGKSKRKKPFPVVRDVRLFFNTVNHAVETMRRSGIEAKSEKSETEDYIEYVVRIPKNHRATIAHTA